MKKLTILLLAALISGCALPPHQWGLPPQYAKAPNRCLVRGVSSNNSSVLIRSVDGGDVIFVWGYQIGDKVWLEPGVHKVSVMCSTSTSGGAYTVGSEAEVNVQPGYTYYLKADPIKSINDTPHLEVTKKENK